MKLILKMCLFSATLLIATLCIADSKTKPKANQNKEILLAINSHETKPSKQFIKVALLLDTSNSMDGLIEQAKAQLWEVVNELSYARYNNDNPNLEIALYEYGNDNLNGEEGFIRQVLAFSNDLDDISKELFSLRTNGGQEYCGQVLKSSLNQLSWGNNPDDLKLIFIAGNEPFTQGKIDYKTVSKEAYKNDITINTIFCGDYTQGISTSWKDGADLTHGDYIAINHNHRTVHVASPYDDELLNLNKKLNETYIGYGKRGKAKMAMQAEQDNNAESYSKANAVSRTVSKSSHLYKNSKWDLVDAVETEEIIIDNLKEDALPKELKGKSKKEIKDYISNKNKERQSVQKKIKELNTKREIYISKEQKDNALENALLKAIKTQAKHKNYKWD